MIFNVTTNIVEKEASVMDLLQMQSEIHQEQMLLSMDNVSTETAITIDKVKAIIEKIKKFIKKLWKHVIITIRKKLRGEHKCVVSDDHIDNIEYEWLKEQQVTLFMNKESDIDVLKNYYNKLTGDVDIDNILNISTSVLKIPSRNTKHNLDIDTFIRLHESNLKFLQILSNIASLSKVQGTLLKTTAQIMGDSNTANKFVKNASKLQEMNTKFASLITGLVNTAISEFPKTVPTETIQNQVMYITRQYSKWADTLK